MLVSTGCGPKTETEADRQARWAQGKLTGWENTNGIGPFSQSTFIPRSDGSKAAEGRAMFITKCATCHQLDGDKTGPALRDVTKRRTEAYILNQMLNPEQMGKLHPDGKRLLAKYAQFMAKQIHDESEAFVILDFLKSEAAKPVVPLEQQPGYAPPAATTTTAATTTSTTNTQSQK